MFLWPRRNKGHHRLSCKQPRQKERSFARQKSIHMVLLSIQIMHMPSSNTLIDDWWLQPRWKNFFTLTMLLTYTLAWQQKRQKRNFNGNGVTPKDFSFKTSSMVTCLLNMIGKVAKQPNRSLKNDMSMHLLFRLAISMTSKPLAQDSQAFGHKYVTRWNVPRKMRWHCRMIDSSTRSQQ